MSLMIKGFFAETDRHDDSMGSSVHEKRIPAESKGICTDRRPMTMTYSPTSRFRNT